MRNAFQQAGILPGTGGSWSALGPQPMDTSQCPMYCIDYNQVSGRITAIAVNPTDPTGSDVWIGGADGGVWHSTNGGGQWTPALDVAYSDYPALSIGAIAISPTNPQDIVVGTGEANNEINPVMGDGIFVSTDGGQNFTPYLDVAGQLQYKNVARIAINGSTAVPSVVMATSNGIWQSSNYTTWTQAFATVTATDVVFDPTHTSVAWAGVQATVQRDSSNNLISSPIMISTNYGQANTWTAVDLGLPDNTFVRRASLGISQDGEDIYAILTDQSGNLLNGKVYVSLDGGTSWQGIVAPPQMSNDSGESQWAYNSTVAVDPADPANVYFGGVDLWESYNYGSTWNNVTQTYGSNIFYVHPDHHALTFIPGQGAFYDGNDGGVWRGSQTCTLSCYWSFTDLNGGGLNITQFYSGSVGTLGSNAALWGGAQDNGESHYPIGATGAAQWTQSFGGDGGDTAVDYTNNANVYEEFVDGNLYYSNDGGGSWKKGWGELNVCDEIATPNCTPHDQVNFVMPFVMSATHPQTLFAGTDRVYKTTNGAANWTALTSAFLDPFQDTPISALAVAPTDDNVIYAGFNDGVVCGTTDGFASPPTCTIPGPGNMLTGLAVDPTNASVVYATFNGYDSGQHYHVYRSINAGVGGSWTDISTGLPDAPAMSVLVNPNDPQQIFVGTDAGVYTTSDPTLGANVTWSHFGSGLPDVQVSRLFTDHTGENLYLATYGRGMWTIPIAGQHVYQGTCVGGTATNYMYSIDAVSGVVAWSVPTTTLCPSKPALANGVLYFTSNNSSANGVHAFDASTGTSLWSYLTSVSASSAPVVANGLVYIGTSDNHVDALNPDTGALAWTSACLCKAKQINGVSPIYANGTLYVSDGAQYIYALDANTGATLWTYASSPKLGTPGGVVYANGLLYFATSSSTSTGWTGYMNALDTTSHKLVWSYQPVDGYGKAVAPMTPTVANGTVYFGTTASYAYALNASTGAFIFHVLIDYTYRSLYVTNNVVYVSVGDATHAAVQAFDASNGSSIWNYTSIDGWVDVQAASGNLLYLSDTYDGVEAITSSNATPVWNSPGYPMGEYAKGLVVGS